MEKLCKGELITLIHIKKHEFTTSLTKERICNQIKSRILGILRENPSITLDEVAEKIGKSPRTVKAAVKSMRERGALERVGGKKNGSWKVK